MLKKLLNNSINILIIAVLSFITIFYLLDKIGLKIFLFITVFTFFCVERVILLKLENLKKEIKKLRNQQNIENTKNTK